MTKQGSLISSSQVSISLKKGNRFIWEHYTLFPNKSGLRNTLVHCHCVSSTLVTYPNNSKWPQQPCQPWDDPCIGLPGIGRLSLQTVSSKIHILFLQGRPRMVPGLSSHSSLEMPTFPFVGSEENATTYHLLPFTNARKTSNFPGNIPS